MLNHSLFRLLNMHRKWMSAVDWMAKTIPGKRVAVIGNAHSLLESDFGAKIDACDMIIRLNRAPPASPHSHGSRTDVLAFSVIPDAARWVELHEPTLVCLTPKIARIPHWMFQNTGEMINLPRDRWQRCTDLLSGTEPSTGFLALNLLLEVNSFADLQIFGFDWFKTGSLSRREPITQSRHNFALEQEILMGRFEGRPEITVNTLVRAE